MGRVVRASIFALLVTFGAGVAYGDGSWRSMPAPLGFDPLTMVLLQDGSILVNSTFSTDWRRLHPDASGSYASGLWEILPPSPRSKLYFPSCVLPDGRVLIMGGEYADGVNAEIESNDGMIFDPQLNQWSKIGPHDWDFVGDAPSVLLADGRFMIGSIATNETSFFDPKSLNWTPGPAKFDSASSEEGWVLMQDGGVLVPECQRHPAAEKFVPRLNRWIVLDDQPVDLVDPYSIEIGAGMSLPDGRVFFTGATGHTAIYQPGPTDDDRGSWRPGPELPTINGRKLASVDSNIAVEPNGSVMFTAAPLQSGSNFLNGPTFFCEWTPGEPSIRTLAIAPWFDIGPSKGRMLLLPSGEIAYTSQGSHTIYLYQPGNPIPGARAWQPVIKSFPQRVSPGTSFKLFGSRLCGLTQGSNYGDDANESTNYPLVRLKSTTTGEVTYCRAHDAAYLGISPGDRLNSVIVDVPKSVATDIYSLEVVANGIASDPSLVAVTPNCLPVAGRVNLENFGGDPSTVAITVSAYPSGSLTPSSVSTVPLNPDGSFTTTMLAAASSDISIKASHWLAQRVVPGRLDLQISLANGDIDGNNIINILDYAILTDHFNTAQGDPDFVKEADLDGNGAINVNDYAIVSDNFNRTGD